MFPVNDDLSAFAIVNNATYKLLIANTPIDYWTSVTNVLGGTSKRCYFTIQAMLKLIPTSNIRLSNGTTAQRPTVQGGLDITVPLAL